MLKNKSVLLENEYLGLANGFQLKVLDGRKTGNDVKNVTELERII